MNQPIIINTPIQNCPESSRLIKFEREVNEITKIYLDDLHMEQHLHMPDCVIRSTGNAFDRVMEHIADKYRDVVERLYAQMVDEQRKHLATR